MAGMLSAVGSVAKTNVIVFHGPAVTASWTVGVQQLPCSQSFKYLGLVSHESGPTDTMLQRLCQVALGSGARLVAKLSQLGCASLFPMQRQLFSTLVAPAASHGCVLGRLSQPAEVWSLCTRILLKALSASEICAPSVSI